MFDTSKKNKRKSFFIVFVFVILIFALVYFVCNLCELDSIFIVPTAIILSVSSAVGAYYNSDKIVLSMSNAKPATMEQNKKMINNLEGLCLAAGLPIPKLYIIEDSAPNAFATGRNPSNAVICVTTALLDKLDDYELEGVLAHELSHIKNYDILLQTIVIVFVGFVSIMADLSLRMIGHSGDRRRDRDDEGVNPVQGIILLVGAVFILLSPIAAELMKLAMSRKREFLADSSAIELTRNPQGLIDALLKISNDDAQLRSANKSTASMYICSPLRGKDAQSKLYMTHPPIEERIKALKNIS